MKKITRYVLFRIQIILILFIIVISSLSLPAQQCIRGKILIENSLQPIEGAKIRVAGRTDVLSGPDGHFRICELSGKSVELNISHLGYKTFQYHVDMQKDTKNEITIILQPVSLMMDELVVTATRTENLLPEIPVRVNVLSARMIQNSASGNIDEILEMVPGLTVNRPFGILSSKSTVSMRGMSGKEQARVLVLVDGIPVNKSDGGTVDWNMIDPGSVEKIELTKGAGSALYGGNAMGGVINIITKRPSEKLSGRASLEYGSFNTLGGRLNFGADHPFAKSGRSFYWMANTFYRQSDGYITQSEADQLANPYIIKSNMKEFGALLKTGFNFNKNHCIDARFQLYNDNRGTGEKVYLSKGNTTDHDSWGVTLSYKGKLKHFDVFSSAFVLEEDYKKVNEYLKDDYTWYDVLSVRRDAGWFSNISAPFGKNHVLTAGVDLKNGSVDAYDKYYTSTDIVYNVGKMFTYAMFLQDELKLWKDKIKMIVGIRFDKARFYDGSFRIEESTRETEFMQDYQVPVMPEENWNALSPRLSVQRKWKGDDRIYLMYARGFRASVLDDLCRSGRIKGGFKIANPSLQPEYLNNYEAGMDYRLNSRIRSTISVYYLRGKDFQYYVSNGQTIDMGFGDRPIFIRANISKVEVIGAEAELKMDISEKFSLFANYGYNHSIIIDYQKIAGDDTINLDHNYLTDVPLHVFSCGGQFSDKLINASLLVHYNGSMYINDQNIIDEILLSDQYPAYTTVDLKVWKTFNSHFSLSISIQNIFDVKYYDSKDAVGPGRFITGELAYKF